MTLENSGTTDRFNVRVEDGVLISGTSETAVATGAVDRSWHVSEAVAGGSDVTMQVLWNLGEELPNFDRTQSYISYWGGSVWQEDVATTATRSAPYTLTRNNLTELNTVFAVGSSRKLTTNTNNVIATSMKINFFPFAIKNFY